MPIIQLNPLWQTYKKLLNMAIEVVHLPIKNYGFSSSQTVSLPEDNIPMS
jgi:hypothetical protein